ncbi:hypothetical protein LCGC14_1227910 [marine sediment metagenome]|uniref:Uncharacterized protein n=1 Tax=marine sediment metagenome TaxID=412755 RepID=A0A0F9PDQ7_9ZZZZ|nr:hypothetical protein [Candidatus Scalindua sp.]
MKTKLKKFIREVIKSHGINTRGYRTEYQIMALNEEWDGDFWTLNQAVDEMIRLKEGNFDVWITQINWSEPPFNNCMGNQYFNVKDIIQ